MKRVPFLLIVLAVLPVAAAAICYQPENQEWRPCDDIDVYVNALSTYAFYLNCYEGDTLYGDFDVLDGDINFAVCDQTNYDLFMDGYDASGIFSRQNVGSLSWSVSIPAAGTWYVVFGNDNLFFSRHIVGTINRTTQSGTFVTGLIMLGGLAALVAVCAVVVRRSRHKPAQPQVQYSQSTQSTGPAFPVRTIQCPFCGRAGLSPDARMCPNCGHPFSSTEVS